MSLTLYLLRHGQTSHTRDNVFCGSLDPELTADGVAMAEAFAAAYKDRPWAAVYASPMRRTVQTARPLCQALRIDMQLRDGLREISYGQWEGLSLEEVQRDFADDYLRWTADPAWHPPTEGESAALVANRALQVVEEVRQRHATGDLLLVSHKATIRILLCSLLGIDVRQFRYRLGCPIGCVSVVEFTRHGPLLQLLADRSHLAIRHHPRPGA